MQRRDSQDGAVTGRRLVVENEVLALGWLRDFEGSQPFSTLAAPAKQALSGAVRVMAYCFSRRWSRVTDTPHPLNEMTSDDAIDVLTEQLPRRVAAVDSDAVIEALVEFLSWAAKSNKIQNRDVEYACRTRRHDAAAAMRDERKWAPVRRSSCGPTTMGLTRLTSNAFARTRSVLVSMTASSTNSSLQGPPLSEMGSGSGWTNDVV